MANEFENIVEPEFADNEIAVEDQIKELEERIANMKKDKEAKCKMAKEQLIETLSITSEKYLTATGVAEALKALRFSLEKERSSQVMVHDASKLAVEMSNITRAMTTKAVELEYSKMNELCDDFYNPKFAEDDTNTPYDLAFEMLCIDLCRNVGSIADDMVEFIKHTQADIDATGEKLKELKEENK